MTWHVFVGPDLESKLFRSYEMGAQWCEFHPGWSYIGAMEEMLDV